MESSREQLEKRILRISFVMSCMLSAVEVAAAIAFRSQTVLMDAIFDSAELIMMGPFLVLVPLLYRPVNERHPYGYAQVESLFLIAEPVKELIRGFRQMMLFSPPEDVMDKVRMVVNNALGDYPYEAAFIDVIQTGRKTWIEVYLKGTEDTHMIDIDHLMALKGRVTADLQDEFDQLYVEFKPDLPEI